MENKPRKWWIAALLSLLEPGLGQIYNGQARKGILFLLLPLLLLPGLLLCLDSAYVLIYLGVSAVLIVSFYVIVIGDAVKYARKYGSDFHLKKYNKVVIYLGIIILATGLSTSLNCLLKTIMSKLIKYRQEAWSRRS